MNTHTHTRPKYSLEIKSGLIRSLYCIIGYTSKPQITFLTTSRHEQSKVNCERIGVKMQIHGRELAKTEMWCLYESVWVNETQKEREDSPRVSKPSLIRSEASHPVNANPQVHANVRPGQQGSNVLLSLLYHLVWPHHITLQAHVLLCHWELGRSSRQSQDRVLRGREPIPTREAWGERMFHVIFVNLKCGPILQYSEAAQTCTHFFIHWGLW